MDEASNRIPFGSGGQGQFLGLRGVWLVADAVSCC